MIALAVLLAAAQPAPAAKPAPAASAPAAVTTASGLRFETLQPGTGPKPALEDAVLVTYEGRLADGTVFDASSEPVGFGVADLIPGFTEALLLMSQGGTYRVRIPSHLAYGEQGGGPIPPNAELVFTVSLIDIGRPAAPASPAPAQ